MKNGEGWILAKRDPRGNTEVYPVLFNGRDMEIHRNKEDVWNYILKKQPQFQYDKHRLKNSVYHSKYQMVRVKYHIDKQGANMEVLEVEPNDNVAMTG